MTSPFPALLRRSSFATYDPLITRIYTSPSASSGDWGWKYSTPLPKGPKYLKVADLDAGKAVQTNYTSGESEARWIEAWGSGRVRWSRKDAFGMGEKAMPKGNTYRDFYPDPSRSAASTSNAVAESSASASSTLGSKTPTRPAREEMWMDDIEAMTPGEFEHYLDRIRSSRSSWRSAKLEGLSANAKARLSDPTDQTLAFLNMAGHTSPVDGANVQTSLANSSLSRPSSSRLLSRPHRLAGLSYSNGPSIAPSADERRSPPRFVHPLFTFPGRALDRATTEQKASDYTRRSNPHIQTAWPMIVSAGGQIGVSNQATTISDKSRSHVTPVDYTRTKPSAGEGRWTVTKATLDKPPMVVGLRDSDAVSRWWDKEFGRRISAAYNPRPMDTMRLNVEFDAAPQGDSVMNEAGRGAWVEKGTGGVALSEEDNLGIRRPGVEKVLYDSDRRNMARLAGGSKWKTMRSNRARMAMEQEVRQEQNQTVKGLLSKLKAQEAGAGAGAAGKEGAGESHGRVKQGKVGDRTRRHGAAGAAGETGTPRI